MKGKQNAYSLQQNKKFVLDKGYSLDTVRIIESGKAALHEKTSPDQAGKDSSKSTQAPVNVIKREPVIYTNTGESAGTDPHAAFSISV